MESIEEQWNPPSSIDILSSSWIDITSAKKAARTWILDRGESWAPSNQDNKTRLQLHCLLSTCSFKLRVALKSSLFRITSYTPHDCPPSTHANFKQQNSAWYLASLVERDITINRKIKPKEIRERAGIYHKLQRVPYMPAWRARERFLDMLNGDEGASFNLIPAWIDKVEGLDDTTTPFFFVEMADSGRFEAIFVMLGPIRSTLNTLRPFYALDGTHTRSRYNLTLLIAVGIDAEDRILPLAWALVPIENERWWGWFCQNLATAFEDDLPPNFVIISDRDKGLLNAVGSELPDATHAMCCQHIAENIHKKFGKEYKAPFWQIARAQSQSAFETAVQNLQRESPKVEEYISSIGYNNFAFACFLQPRFGHDTSNIVESTNSMWREIRELPPLQLLDGIYQWNMTTFYERQRVVLDPGNSVLSNAAYRSYKHRESAARGFRVLPSSETNFLVTTSTGADFVVDLPLVEDLELILGLLSGSCSCLKYQDFSAPCSHAIACIQYLGQDPYRYFHPYYKWQVSKNTYHFPVPPMSLQGLQATNNPALLPPIKRAKRGRPKVARIRATYQENKRIYNCSVCHQSGHNRRVCPNQPIEHGRAQRARDQLVEGKC
jgi:hypothetical protein